MGAIFLSVLNMSLTASYCILFIILIRFLLRREAKIYSYVLWIFAGFRLLSPITLKSVFSFLQVRSHKLPQDIMALPQINEGNLAINQNLSQAAGNQAIILDSIKHVTLWEKATKLGAVFWIIGIVLLLIYSMISIGKLYRMLHGATFVEKGVYTADNLKTPFVFGIFKPKIYLPECLSAEERSYVLAHERVHIKRFDYIIKEIAYLILCVHWFNPLVWIAFRLMVQDMEMSCDEAVIRELGSEIKKGYSNSLLSMTVGSRIVNGIPLAFGEGSVKSRIKNILKYKKKSVVISLSLIILIGVVGIGLMLNPEDSLEDKQRALAKAYAEAFCERDSAAILSLYADRETALQNPCSDTLEDGTYHFGWSSPWPMWGKNRYRIIYEEDKATIYFNANDSEPHVTVFKDEIYFEFLDGEYKITKERFTRFDEIISLAEFNDAYLFNGTYYFYDLEDENSAEALLGHVYKEDSHPSYANYKQAVTAAAYFLNLSGGTGTIYEEDTSGKCVVNYIFADGTEAQIPMYYYQKEGHESGIWLVDARAN